MTFHENSIMFIAAVVFKQGNNFTDQICFYFEKKKKCLTFKNETFQDNLQRWISL